VNYIIKGHIEGVVILVTLHDDMSEDEKNEILDRIQHFVNQFDSVMDFDMTLEYIMDKEVSLREGLNGHASMN